MEGVRGYWKRRDYQRLKVSREPRRMAAMAATRFGQRRPRLSWPRLNLLKIVRSISPKTWLARLRNVYVDMMLGWSHSQAFTTGMSADTGMSAFGKAQLKEYDEKVIVELYGLILVSQTQDNAAVKPIVWIPGHVLEENEV